MLSFWPSHLWFLGARIADKSYYVWLRINTAISSNICDSFLIKKPFKILCLAFEEHGALLTSVINLLCSISPALSSKLSCWSWYRISWYSSSCPGTWNVDLADLKLRDLSAPNSLVLGLEYTLHHIQPTWPSFGVYCHYCWHILRNNFRLSGFSAVPKPMTPLG